MQRMKRVLVIAMVTALTFTSITMPVSASANTVAPADELTQSQQEMTQEVTVENVEQEQSVEEIGAQKSSDEEMVVEEDINQEETKQNIPIQEEDNSSQEETDSKDSVKENISEIQALFNQALAENGTITLEKDLELDEMLELALPKEVEHASITIELAGYTIHSQKAQIAIHVAEGVEVNIEGKGNIVSNVQDGIIIYNQGTVKLNHIDLEATGEKSIGILNDSLLEEKGVIIKSGTIKADWFAIGKTVKAEVSKNRPTAFFAAAGIPTTSITETQIEEGLYSVPEEAQVIEESHNTIQVQEKLVQEELSREQENKSEEEAIEEAETPKLEEQENKGVNSIEQVVPQNSKEGTSQVPETQETVPVIVAPQIPNNVAVNINNYNSLKVTWSPVSDAKGYIVERIQIGVDGDFREVKNLTATEYNDVEIAVGKEYTYRILAYTSNESNEMLKSAPSIEVTEKTTIATPQSLTAVQSSSTVLKLNWEPVEGAVKYNIYRAQKGGKFKLVSSTESTDYKDSKLKTGTKYTYKVTAVNGDYESGDSNKVSLYAAAASVTKLKAKSKEYNKIEVSWKKAKGATKYVIYRSTKEASGYKKIKTVTNTKYTDTVKTGVKYYYKVVSYSNKAKGGESKIVSSTTRPATPTNVKATSKAYNSAKVTWTKSKGAGSYAIYRSTSKKSGYTLIKSVSKGKSSYTDKTVVAGNTYYYKVCAVTKKVEGKMSKVASVKVKPSTVKELAIKSAGGKNVTLNWSDAKGAESYEIYRSTQEKKGYKKIATTSELSFLNTSLKNGKTYYYRVYAKRGKIKSDYKQVSYVNPSKVYLSTNSLSLQSGEKGKLKVSFKPSSVSNSTMTWSSADTSIATVSKKGVVTAVAAGITKVTATAVNGVKATCEVRVDQEPTGVVVVLDPGHGGRDSGATYGSLKESDLNLKISNYTKTELEKYNGVIVEMTRTTDTFVSLVNRTTIAKEYGADLFISQHLNSATPAANGAEVFVSLNGNYNAQSSKLGSRILDNLGGLGINRRGVKTREGSNGDYYSVIRTSVSNGFPGIIVEGAFLTSPKDRELLSTEAGLKSIGVATATGIAEYYGLKKK